MIAKQINCHFSEIAQRYKEFRKTDDEPVIYIKKKLRKLTGIKAADAGCGDGRYDVKLFQYLGEKLLLYCVDCNEKMLEQLTRYLTEQGVTNFRVRRGFASALPLEDDSLDCLFTFNAIHHFPLSAFLTEAARVLRPRGFLFIYTRLKNQNSRNIWGRYFPLFTKKETRLYELDALEYAIHGVAGLSLQSVEIFKYERVSSLDRLVEQARNHHYSTFQLYSDGEFERSLIAFKRNLRRRFHDLDHIDWVDENVLLVVRKHPSIFPKRFG